MSFRQSLNAMRSMGMSFRLARTLFPQRRRRRVVACLCLLAACSAPESRESVSESAAPPAKPTCAVRGLVLGWDDQPVEGAWVEAHDRREGTSWGARTGPDGTFVFPDLPAGATPVLSVEHPAYAHWPLSPCDRQRPVREREVTVRLRTSRVEPFVVQDKRTSEPLQHVVVEVYRVDTLLTGKGRALLCLTPERYEFDTTPGMVEVGSELSAYRVCAEGHVPELIVLDGSNLGVGEPILVRLAPESRIAAQVDPPPGPSRRWTAHLEMTSFWPNFESDDRYMTIANLDLVPSPQATVAEVSPEGQVEFAGLPHGDYSLTICDESGRSISGPGEIEIPRGREEVVSVFIKIGSTDSLRIALSEIGPEAKLPISIFLRSERHHFGAFVDELGAAEFPRLEPDLYRVELRTASGDHLVFPEPIHVGSGPRDVLVLDFRLARKR